MNDDARFNPAPTKAEISGGNVNYYRVQVTVPNQAEAPYIAECSDIIEALQMDFNEGEAFKALWRRAASRLGKEKANNTAYRDAQKVEHFARRMLILHEVNGPQ